MSQARLSACMLIPHKGHTDTIQVYSVTVMTHVKALQAGHSSQGTSEPITPGRGTPIRKSDKNRLQIPYVEQNKGSFNPGLKYRFYCKMFDKYSTNFS